MELIEITTRECFARYREEWSSILEENQNTNPFVEFDWVNEWWKYLGEDKRVEIMAIRHADKIIAFFPFLCRKRVLGYTYNFIAFGQANYMNFIATHHFLERSIEFVFNEIMSRKRNVVFYLHGLLDSSGSPQKLGEYLRKRNISFSVHPVITPYIDLEKIKLEEYIRKRKKLHRLDRREKRLRENGDIKLARSKPDEMESIFQLHDNRWKKKRDTSGFTNEKEKKFYSSLAKINEGPMKTEIDSIYLNNKIIAFNYGFNCRGKYLGYVLGFDDNFDVFGPGRFLEKEKILQCKYDGDKVFDLSIGYENYKFDWNTHLDYTKKMIFSSDSLMAKVYRIHLSLKETIIERIKENHKFVLFIRNRVGKLQFDARNLMKKKPQDLGQDVVRFLKLVKSYLYANESYIVYQMEKREVPDVKLSEEFVQLTLNDAMENEVIATKHMKEICRRIYGGYKGYYPKDNLAYENIFWTNDKVLRIDRISYIEQFRKGSVCFNNWNLNNLMAVCSLIKRKSNARTVYVTVEEKSKVERALLEKVGFSATKEINKRTCFGIGKYHITE